MQVKVSVFVEEGGVVGPTRQLAQRVNAVSVYGLITSRRKNI